MAKAKKTTLAAPFDAEAASAMLAELGQLVAEENALKARLQRLIDRATARASRRLVVLEESIEETKKALRKFADKNRASLCANGGKTITLPTGDLYWKSGDEAVEVPNYASADKVIEALIAAGQSDCLRVKTKLDKDAIKAAWHELAETKISGLRLVKREFFYLQPTGATEPLQMKTKTVEIIDELDGNPKKKE